MINGRGLARGQGKERAFKQSLAFVNHTLIRADDFLKELKGLCLVSLTSIARILYRCWIVLQRSPFLAGGGRCSGKGWNRFRRGCRGVGWPPWSRASGPWPRIRAEEARIAQGRLPHSPTPDPRAISKRLNKDPLDNLGLSLLLHFNSKIKSIHPTLVEIK